MSDRATHLRDDAVDVLRDALAWQLAPGRWERLGEVLDAAIAAQATDDLDAFGAAIAQLMLVGPVRITRIGAIPTVPAPSPIRERINHLIHELSGGPGSKKV